MAAVAAAAAVPALDARFVLQSWTHEAAVDLTTTLAAALATARVSSCVAAFPGDTAAGKAAATTARNAAAIARAAVARAVARPAAAAAVGTELINFGGLVAWDGARPRRAHGGLG